MYNNVRQTADNRQQQTADTDAHSAQTADALRGKDSRLTQQSHPLRYAPQPLSATLNTPARPHPTISLSPSFAFAVAVDENQAARHMQHAAP
eukprot:scaffold33298_cov146-Isochrysis_galbana.AAC.2